MRHIVFLFCIIIFSIELNGQTGPEILSGKVSFISSQNIYVKFTSTTGVSVGDTLYNTSSAGKLTPVLKVNNLSSSSCVCTAISSALLSVSDPVVARKKNNGSKTEEKVVKNAVKAIPRKVAPVDAPIKPSNPDEPKQKISGSISAYSYTDFSNTAAANSTRFRYTFSINARNIANSGFSIENYMSFNHKLGDWSVVKNNVFNALKIYSLAARYDLGKTLQISLGRKINSKISSIGAMDGLQVEKSFNKFSLGAVAGFRPDFINYGFNSKLFQYGGYLAYSSVTSEKYIESSLAFMQQMNSGKTDRRFLYFQLSNSLIKNVSFFSTFEVDLYKLKIDSLGSIPQNTFNLTGLYLSLRYKMFKNFSISGSYDGRKNIMYYETYKTFIDRILESEMRQSIRLQADYRITKNLTFGLQSGYRFLKSDPHSSKNFYGYLMYNQIPGINVSITLNGTYLESNYLNSKIFGGKISRDFFHGKFYTEVGYRYVDYSFPESLLNTVQNIGEMNLSWQFSKISFSVNYEGTFEKQNKYNRLFLQIRKRF
jgi:hypothetical protein